MKGEYGLAVVGVGSDSALHAAEILSKETGKEIIIISGIEAEKMNSLNSIRKIPIVEVPIIKSPIPELTGREKRRLRRKQERKAKRKSYEHGFRITKQYEII